jgi:hypothetical protein
MQCVNGRDDKQMAIETVWRGFVSGQQQGVRHVRTHDAFLLDDLHL